MLQIHRAGDRFQSDHGWLRSSFSFSFADYYDPNNMQFGPMRVLNDDWIAPSKGFGMHPHQEMEIVTVVLNGLLEHKDSIGNTAQTTWGGIQRMSAGTGLFHSEYNRSEEESLELLQMWFLPAVTGLKPSYETTAFDTDALKEGLTLIVSGDETKQQAGRVASIHQDMSIYLSEPQKGSSHVYTAEQGRRTLLFVLEGTIDVNGDTTLFRRDSARIADEQELVLTASENSRVMLIDLP
ncbi:pirin family protein [Paenibacillus harenae]|uniref:Redox-sensitive bicupin YhaK (Pirin superfamily) n=1 Tax=Paenibacillus harenae TaxID=306543 RepID=A0ABT9U8R2_PAEHA|nr:pirin family protein [Paenibacillus harenae]MDQ0115388.1 redox-sensitive bicupin YhaK (pirin superfamily) [Paenibacillus harenae]